LSQITSTTSNLTVTANLAITSTIAGLGSVGYISIVQLNSTVAGITATNQSNLVSTVNTLGTFPGYISSGGLQSTVAGLGSLGFISIPQLTSTTTGINLSVINSTTSTTNGLGSLGYISTAQIVSTVIGFSNTTRSNLISTVNTLTYVTTVQLTSTQTGLGAPVTTTQVNQAATDLITNQNTIHSPSTVAGLGSLGYISTPHVVSTVIGINLITTTNMTSTTNTLGSSVPRYISTAQLTSTYVGVSGLGYMVLSNLTSTTSNFQSGSYGTTSTLAGLGSAGYISTTQLNSTVAGITVTNELNLISTVNTLGSSVPRYISSLSLQSSVAGLGTAGYISLSQLTSTTVGLPSLITLPTSMINSINGLAGTTSGVTTLYNSTEFYISITYTPSLIIYAEKNIYTNNFDGSAHTLLYTGNVPIYGLTCDGTNVYAATAVNIFSVSLTTRIITPFASSYTFSASGIRGISLDSTYSNLYVCDNGNGNLLKINVTTQIPTIVVSIPGMFYIAIDSSSINAYVTIYNTGIYKIRLSDGNYTQLSTFSQAFGISLDSTQQIAYVTSSTSTIHQIDLTTGTPTLIAGNGIAALQDGPLLTASFNEPFHLIFNIYDSCIYVADSLNYAIRKITLKTFSYISSLSLQSSVAGLGNLPLSYISTASLTSTVAGLGTFGYLSTAYLISTTAGSSNINMSPFTSTTAGLGTAGYISTSALSNIVPDIYSVTTFARNIQDATSIAFTSTFIFYTGGNNIYRNTYSGNQETIFYSSNAPFTSIACDLSNVYAVPTNRNQIISISISTSNATVLANTTTSSGSVDGTDPTLVRFNGIYGLCVDPTNRYLYIAEYFGNRLRRLQFSNGRRMFNVISQYSFLLTLPLCITVDSVNEYAYLGRSGGIVRVSLVQNNLSIINTTVTYVSGISIDSTQTLAYAVNRNTFTINTINLTTGVSQVVAGSTPGFKDGNGTSALFSNPNHCVYNPYDSCVYIADSGNNAIRKMTTTLYASTISGLNASAVIQRIAASNSSLASPVASNFVASSYVLPSMSGIKLWLDGGDPLGTGVAPPIGTSIPSWIDKSGNGYNAIGTGSYSNGITFSGVYQSTGYLTPIPTNMLNQTIFIVYTTTSPLANMYLIGTTGRNSGIAAGMSGGTNEIALSFSETQTTPYQVVQTFAGSNGVSGQTNATGLNSRFNSPIGLVADTSGNIYVADNINHVIRKITQSGDVTTFAGTMGTPGFTDAIGTNARFNGPFGLAIDSSGNIYVSDIANRRIRKITSSGSVSTLAGNGIDGNTDGSSASATFNQPYGIAVDSSGYIYVGEVAYNVIRRIDSSGTVIRIAGTGSAGSSNSIGARSTFNFPYALACDTSGNIFVGDNQNNMIRKISKPFSVIANVTTHRPLGITFNPTNGDIYFTALSYNNSIWTYNPNNTPSLYVCANIPSAQFNNQPWGIVYDTTSGLTFASDKNGSVLYRVTPGTPTTPGTCAIVAGVNFTPGNVQGNGIGTGNGLPQSLFYNPAAMTSTPGVTDTIFIADVTNNAIRSYSISTGYVDNLSIINLPAVGANNLTSIAATNDGTRIYIAFTQIHAIYYLTLRPIISSTITFVAGNTGGTTSVFGFVDGQGSTARFNSPEGICVDTAGNVYVSDYGNKAVRMITPDGYVSTLTSPNNMPPGLNSNTSPGIAVKPDGSLVVGVYNSSLCTITLGTVTTFATGINNIQSLAIDSSANLYVGELFKIEKITSGGVVSTLAGNGIEGYLDGNVLSAKFTLPSGLALYSGTLYISERNSHTIRNIPTPTYTNTITGGAVTSFTRLFTSVVQMGTIGGVIGYENSTQILQGSILDSFADTGTAYIGMRYNLGGGGFMDRFYVGTIQEIIIYNRALDTSQRTAVQSYLTTKWVLTRTAQSNTTTPNIYLSNLSTIINPNLYATTITADTFTAYMPKGGTSSNGYFVGGGANVTNISDRRLKTDIRPIENALEKVSRMQAVKYRLYRDPAQSWIGYVAQDLESILPDVVRTDGEGWKSIQYATLPALIIEAVKELNEKYEKIKYLLSNSG